MNEQIDEVTSGRVPEARLMKGLLRRARELLASNELADLRTADHLLFQAGMLREVLRLGDDHHDSIELSGYQALACIAFNQLHCSTRATRRTARGADQE